MLPCSVTSDLRAAYHYSSGFLKSHLGERMRCGKFDRKPPLIDAPRKEEWPYGRGEEGVSIGTAAKWFYGYPPSEVPVVGAHGRG